MLSLTRRQASRYLIELANQKKNDAEFQAGIHGAKLKEGMTVQKFDKKTDAALSSYSEQRYKKMMEGVK